MNSSCSSSSPAIARILLVDDNRLGLAARKALLEEQGYQVTTAAEGSEALSLFSPDRFDLVITDYKMPRMDGRRLIAEIRAQSPAIPVILISGYAEALGLNAENTGADIVIPKNAHEVAQLVRSAKRLLQRASRKPPRSQGLRARAATRKA